MRKRAYYVRPVTVPLLDPLFQGGSEIPQVTVVVHIDNQQRWVITIDKSGEWFNPQLLVLWHGNEVTTNVTNDVCLLT